MIVGELLAHIGFKVDEGPLHKLESSLDSIKNKLNLIIGYEAVTKLYELAENFAKWGEELYVTAQNIGVTTEALQGLDYAAERSGVSQELMAHSLAHLAHSLYEAKNGSIEMQTHFAKAGISGDMIKNFKSTEDALYTIADQLNNIQDPIKRMGVAQELLGRGGFKMIAFLSQGSKAIREQGAELRKMGLQLSGPQVEALVQVERAFQRLGAVMHAVGAQIAAQVGPGFEFLIDKFIALYSANSKLINGGLSSWIDKLLYGLGFVAGVIYGLIQQTLGLGKALKDAFDAKGLTGVFDVIDAKIKKVFSPENLKKLADELQKLLSSDAFGKAMQTVLDATLGAAEFAAKIGLEIADAFMKQVAEFLNNIIFGPKESRSSPEDVAKSVLTDDREKKEEDKSGKGPTFARALFDPEESLLKYLADKAATVLKTPIHLESRSGGLAGIGQAALSPFATTPQAANPGVNRAAAGAPSSVTVSPTITINNNGAGNTTPDMAKKQVEDIARKVAKDLHSEINRQTIQSLPGN